jgi:colanic acid/amylovoran biosynthesis glycosyltransferase
VNIYIFVNRFPTWSETFVYDEIAGLEKLSHTIRIIALGRNYFITHPILRQLGARDVRYFLKLSSYKDWLYHLKYPDFWRRSLLPSMLSNRFRFFGMNALADLIRREKPDLFLLHFGALGEIYLWLRHSFDIPFVVFFHGDEYNSVQRRRYHDYKNLFSQADFFLVKSRYSQAKIVELGCRPEKVGIIPFGINPDLYPFSQASTRRASPATKVLGIGRLVENKDFELALKVIKKCAPRYPGLEYSIVGDGPLYPQLSRQIRSQGLEKRCFLKGARNTNWISRELSQTDIYLQPSRLDKNGETETFGNTLLEAQLHGLPVLATRSGSIPELVEHDRTGFLAPESDAEALAGYLAALVEDAELRKRMGERGRNNVLSRFNSKKRVLELEQMLIAARAGVRG